MTPNQKADLSKYVLRRKQNKAQNYYDEDNDNMEFGQS